MKLSHCGLRTASVARYASDVAGRIAAGCGRTIAQIYRLMKDPFIICSAAAAVLYFNNMPIASTALLAGKQWFDLGHFLFRTEAVAGVHRLNHVCQIAVMASNAAFLSAAALTAAVPSVVASAWLPLAAKDYLIRFAAAPAFIYNFLVEGSRRDMVAHPLPAPAIEADLRFLSDFSHLSSTV